MKKFRIIFKSLFVLILALMMCVTSLSINTKKVSAATFDSTDFYREPETGYSNSISIVTGLGRTRGTASTTAEFFQNGKTIAGNAYGGYAINGSFNSPADASKTSSSTENRYQQTGASTNKTNSVDIYYGDYVLKGVTTSSVYYNSSTKELFTSSASGRKQLCALGFTNTFNIRFVHVEEDLVVVEHYSANEHTLNVANVADTSFASSLDEYYDKYYTTKDTTNNVMSTIVSNNYSNANGLAQSFEPLTENPLANAAVLVGSNSASTPDASGIYYLSSTYTFSDTHASTDILAIDFDNNQIIYYKVNDNINISFNYASEVTYDVTFMVGNEQYGATQTVYEGATAARPEDPDIPEGQDIFVGWFAGNTKFDFATPITSNLTLEAVFDVEHTVSFINLGHEYVSSAGTLLNASFVSSGSWTNATGGTLDTHNCIGKTVGDYSTTGGLALNGYTMLATLDHLVLTFGDREPLILNLSDLRGTSYFLNSNYELEDRTATGTYAQGDIFKIAVGTSATNTINMRFYKIVEDIKIECVYNNAHTITVQNFGNATNNYIGTGKFKASGNDYNFYVWDPYGATSGNTANLRNGGTIDYNNGIATIYGDYSSSDGAGAALLIHADLNTYTKVIFTYNGETVEYPLVLDQYTNENWYVDDVKVLQYVHNANATFYNIRFFNVAGDVTVKASNDILDPSGNVRRITFDGAGNVNGAAIVSENWETATGGILDASGTLLAYEDYEDENGVPVRVNTSIGKLKQVTLTTGEEEYVISKNDFLNDVDQQLGDYARLVRSAGDKYFDIYFYKVVADINVDIEYDDVTITVDDPYSAFTSVNFNAYPEGATLSLLDDSITVNSSLLKDTNDDSIQIGFPLNNTRMNGIIVSNGSDEFVFDVNSSSTVNDYTFGKLKFARNSNGWFVRFYYLNEDVSIRPQMLETVSASQSVKLNADGSTSLNLSLTLSNNVDTQEAFLRVDGQDLPLSTLNRKVDSSDNIIYTYKIENISPKNMGDAFNIQFFKNNEETFTSEHEISVKSYLTTIINGNYAEELINFAKSMLNYGAYTQLYFRHDVDNLMNEGIDDVDVSGVEANDDYNPVVSNTTEGISAYGQSLSLKYFTDFKVAFRLESGYTINQFEFYDNGEKVSPHRYNDELYYVQVSDLAAPDLAEIHNISVKYQGEGDLVVSTSALGYANLVINDANGNPTLINAMKAMYNYYNNSVALKNDYVAKVSSLDDITPYNGEKVKVAFVGDSITYGYLASDPNTYSYPSVLNNLFNGRYEIGNYGVSASYAIAADSPYNYYAALPQKNYKNTKRFVPSKNFEPDVVVIMLGTNDARSMMNYGEDAQNAFKAAIVDLVGIYKALPSVSKVYVASNIYTGLTSDVGTYLNDSLRTVIQAAANEAEVDYIDLYSATSATLSSDVGTYFNSDLLHPTNAGYAVIAQGYYNYFVNE